MAFNAQHTVFDPGGVALFESIALIHPGPCQIEECLRLATGANRACTQLEQQQQRHTEAATAALRRTESALSTRVAEQVAGRGREISEQIVGEAETRIKREVEQALSTVVKETTSVLRRETDDKLRALTTGKRPTIRYESCNSVSPF